eukprot:355359-Chlamydomonas_euryale.AAC.24
MPCPLPRSRCAQDPYNACIVAGVALPDAPFHSRDALHAGMAGDNQPKLREFATHMQTTLAGVGIGSVVPGCV